MTKMNWQRKLEPKNEAELMQYPYLKRLRNTKILLDGIIIPRNEVRSCFGKILFAQILFQLNDEIITRLASRCTTDIEENIQAYFMEVRNWTYPFKQMSPFAIQQPLVCLQYQTLLAPEYIPIYLKNEIRSTKEMRLPLPDCQIVYIQIGAWMQYIASLPDCRTTKFNRSRQLSSEVWNTLLLRSIHGTFLRCSVINDEMVSKLWMFNRQKYPILQDMARLYRIRTGFYSLQNDQRISDADLLGIPHMLSFKKADLTVVFRQNELNFFHPNEKLAGVICKNNCFQNKIQIPKVTHARSAPFDILAVQKTYTLSESENLQFVFCNNARGDSSYSIVITIVRCGIFARFMNSLIVSKREMNMKMHSRQIEVLPIDRVPLLLSENNKVLSGIQSMTKQTPSRSTQLEHRKGCKDRGQQNTDIAVNCRGSNKETANFPTITSVAPGRHCTDMKRDNNVTDTCLSYSTDHGYSQVGTRKRKFDLYKTFYCEFTRKNKRHKGLVKSNEHIVHHQYVKQERLRLTLTGKPLASITSGHDNGTKPSIINAKLNVNRQTALEVRTSRQYPRNEHSILNNIGHCNEVAVSSDRANKATLDRYAHSLTHPETGTTTNAVIHCSSVFANDTDDNYDCNANGNVNRVIPVAPEERPVQQCSGAMNSSELSTRSEAPTIFTIHPRDPETWAICTSFSTRKPSPDDNTIAYPLGLLLPRADVTNGHVLLTNSCVIDDFLLMLFLVLHFNENLRHKFRRSTKEFDKTCFKIWQHYQKQEFNAGKIVWCLYSDLINHNTKRHDLKGTEIEMIFSGFNKTSITVEEKCSNADCAFHEKTQEVYDVLTVYKEQGKTLADILESKIGRFICCPTRPCRSKLGTGELCNGNLIRHVVTLPDILAFNLYFLKNSNEPKLYSSCDIPNTIETNGEIYDLQLVRFCKNEHFTGKLMVLDNWVYYDNKEPRLCYFDRDPDFSQLSSCYYVKRFQVYDKETS